MLLKRYLNYGLIEAGCDEAGRGCLAGPVCAAAVILPSGYEHAWLNDSKQVCRTHRNELRLHIEQNAIAWAVGMVSNEEIDKINILNASFLAMHRAIAQLQVLPQMLLIDGNHFNPYPNIDHCCIVKGDERFMSIAAASILAKTYRDKYMQDIDKHLPVYLWGKNKGYPTDAHYYAIAKYGATAHHRKTFCLFKSKYPVSKKRRSSRRRSLAVA